MRAFRSISALLAVSALPLAGCAALTPMGARVAVCQAPLDAPPAARRMPTGCNQITAGSPQYLSEFSMTGMDDPYLAQRNATGAAGGNALLVLSRLAVPRQCLSCPAASPITDCPPCDGAWFEVVFESYACSPQGLAALPATTTRP